MSIQRRILFEFLVPQHGLEKKTQEVECDSSGKVRVYHLSLWAPLTMSVGSIINVFVFLSSNWSGLDPGFLSLSSKLVAMSYELSGNQASNPWISPSPVVVEQLYEEEIWKCCGSVRPGAFPSWSIFVASSKCMGSIQSHNFLVVEAHSIENVADVPRAFVTIWKASIWSARLSIWGIRPTRSPWNFGTYVWQHNVISNATWFLVLCAWDFESMISKSDQRLLSQGDLAISRADLPFLQLPQHQQVSTNQHNWSMGAASW